MRDPERIQPFTNELAMLWTLFPDYRFGQLIMNLCRREDGTGFDDPWLWEEAEWERRIQAYKKKHAP